MVIVMFVSHKESGKAQRNVGMKQDVGWMAGSSVGQTVVVVV